MTNGIINRSRHTMLMLGATLGALACLLGSRHVVHAGTSVGNPGKVEISVLKTDAFVLIYTESIIVELCRAGGAMAYRSNKNEITPLEEAQSYTLSGYTVTWSDDPTTFTSIDSGSGGTVLDLGSSGSLLFNDGSSGSLAIVKGMFGSLVFDDGSSGSLIVLKAAVQPSR